MNHKILLTFSLLSLFLLLINFQTFAEDAPRKPNIILILADDLGWKELGCYGQQKIKTPHIDQMASEGIRFNQF